MIPLFFTLSYFNSHAHMERDQAGNVRRNAVLHFNSHAHVERDCEKIFRCGYKPTNFNSHAHVERDDFKPFRVEVNVEFQLTRSRGA